jgi:hypothetical protein
MHIEMAGDLSAAITAAALKPFTACQEEPKTITTDRGTNFRVIKKRLDTGRKKEEQEKTSEYKNERECTSQTTNENKNQINNKIFE